ncbi:MAG TPA: biosynthetic peptidoglycan transglycosylase [Polyangiaceae bacterium]
MNVLADLPRRTKIAALLGLVCVLGAGGAVGFGPAVRARVASAAALRGLEVQVGQVRPGAGAVWLRDVTARALQIPGASLHVDALRVGFGWHFNLAELEAHGALVELRGAPAELRQQVEAFRNEHRGGGSGGGDVRYLADGVELVWRVRPTQPAQHVWGLGYERNGVHERVALDLLRFNDAGIEIEARGPEAELTRKADSAEGGTQRLLESLRADGVELSVRVEQEAEPEPKPKAKGASAAHPDKGGHFQADPLRGAKLRAALSELSALAARSLPEAAQLDLQGFVVRFRRGNDELNFGPSTLRVTRAGPQVELSLVPKAEASGTPLELKLSLPIAAGEAHAQLRGGPVSLESIGVREGDFGLTGVQAASLQASGDVTLAADGSTLAFSGNGVADHIALSRAELSPSPLSGIRLGFRVRGTTSLDGAKLTLEDGELSFGDVRVDGNGMLTRGEHTVQTRWSGGVPLASCQALLDATPHGFAPLIAGMRLSGTFAVKADLDYDSERPSETRVHLDVANDCHIDQVPPELSPHRFEAPWQREVRGADRLPMVIESGPGTPDWVPYDSISPFMETAVLVCEDGHFERHHGFDFEAIENSIRDNLIQGRFARGASTISMQLAKNLYLGKEKTLGRKLQEAALTVLLEQQLSKQAMMELYLNVIEFGPGIYGIGPAAHYYFAKRASDLSLGQALYIATILPNPERQHFAPDGKVTEAWTRYLQKLMLIAKKIGRVTDAELQAGLAEQVAFHVADSGGGLAATAPSPEEGTDTPSELSP